MQSNCILFFCGLRLKISRTSGWSALKAPGSYHPAHTRWSREKQSTMYNRFGMPYHKPIPDDGKPKRDSGGLATLVEAEKMMQIAILLPCSAFIGWLLGAWADKALHQAWIGIAGIVFGGISGLVYVIRLVMNTDTSGKSGKGSGQL